MLKRITALFGSAAVAIGLAASTAKAETPYNVSIEGELSRDVVLDDQLLHALADGAFLLPAGQTSLHVNLQTACFNGENGSRFLTFTMDHDSGLGKGEGGGRKTFTLREFVPPDMRFASASFTEEWAGFGNPPAGVPDISAKSVAFMRAGNLATVNTSEGPLHFVHFTGSGSHLSKNNEGLLFSYAFGFDNSSLSYLNVLGTKPLKTNDDHANVNNMVALLTMRLPLAAEMMGILVAENLCNRAVAERVREAWKLAPAQPKPLAERRIVMIPAAGD